VPTKIQTLDELKTLAAVNPLDCFILLSIGRSSKTIQYFPDGMEPDDRNDISNYMWDIFSYIDNEWFEFESDEELSANSHIVEAIESGSLFYWGYC